MADFVQDLNFTLEISFPVTVLQLRFGINFYCELFAMLVFGKTNDWIRPSTKDWTDVVDADALPEFDFGKRLLGVNPFDAQLCR